MKRESVFSTVGASCLALLATLVACGSDDTNTPPYNPGGSAGIASPGAAGTSPAAAGTGVITAGGGAVMASAGRGPAVAGTGALPSAGAGAGTAGAGTAGAATAGGGAPPTMGGMTCAMADKSVMGAAAHKAAADLLLPNATFANGRCGFSSCHAANVKKAMLILDPSVTDLKTLVGKTSCEAPALPVVDGSGGDVGLQKSWLWHKLAGPVDASGDLVPDATWGTAGSCGQMGAGKYGSRMPQNGMFMPAELQAILNWICAGAPGAM